MTRQNLPDWKRRCANTHTDSKIAFRCEKLGVRVNIRLARHSGGRPFCWFHSSPRTQQTCELAILGCVNPPPLAPLTTHPHLWPHPHILSPSIIPFLLPLSGSLHLQLPVCCNGLCVTYRQLFLHLRSLSNINIMCQLKGVRSIEYYNCQVPNIRVECFVRFCLHIL